MNHSVRRLTRCAVLTALALAISVCEGLVPLTVLIPLPGLRLGLANLVTVYALCILSSREALAILVSRCLLSALVGGNLTALAFSLTGGVFALLTMWALLHFRGFSLFGVCIAAAPVEMVISRLLRYTQKVITPLVSGIVVTLIGMSLIKVGIIACGGGTAAREAGTFGNPGYLGLAALVLALIVLFNRSRNRYLRMSSIFIGLGTGYLIAWWAGMIDFASVQHYGGINLPVPFKYGLAFDLSSFIAIALIFVITAIEAYGDITANSLISGEPVKGERFIKRASGGILADGMNSMLAGIFNSFPNSVFAQNNGIIQLTGVASRYVGYYIAGMLMILGLFPAIGLVFSLIPEPVLGGATLLMFGTVAAAGIQIIASQRIGRKEVLVIALSLSFGLSVELVPEVLDKMSITVRNIFSSGITTGGLTAILSNLLIRIKET